MSLILGIYSKRGPIRLRDHERLIDDFRQQDRKVHLEVGNRVILALVIHKKENVKNRLANSDDGSQQLLVGGQVFEYSVSGGGLAQGRFDDPAAELLRRFRHGVPNTLAKLDGTFAMALYDGQKDQLLLANDRFGIYPLFVYEDNNFCVFSSEYEPICELSTFDATLDADAIAQYFVLRAPLGDRTFFQHVRNLRPASLIAVGPEGRQCRTYDSLDVAIDHRIDIDSAAEQAFHLLQQAVEQRCRDRDRIQCGLTGGIDSRLVMGAMTSDVRAVVKFRTSGSRYLANDENCDVIIARQLAARFQLQHTVLDKTGPAVRVDGSFVAKSRQPIWSVVQLDGHYGEFTRDKLYDMYRDSLSQFDEPTGRDQLAAILHPQFQRRVSSLGEAIHDEYRRLHAENHELLYMIHWYTRGFFTWLTGGSPNGWVTPYRRPAHEMDSIFRDSAFLRFLLTLPREHFKELRLVDRIYRNHLPQLCAIPSTRKKFVMPVIQKGRRPEKCRAPNYDAILAGYTSSEATWSKQILNPALRDQLSCGTHPMMAQVVDFESWCRAQNVGIQSAC